MKKCPKCGYVELYWRPLRFEPEQEYAHVDNVSFANEVPIGQGQASPRADGFVYWRVGHTIKRLPVETFKERGNHVHPKGSYTESYRTRKKLELETTNQKLIGVP